MAGCSQPVGSNLGSSQGVNVSCNGDTDASTAAYCQDKDVSSSSAVDNVSSACMMLAVDSSQLHNAGYYYAIIFVFHYHESQGYSVLSKWEIFHVQLKLCTRV